MSTLKVNKLRDTAGSADAITLDPNGGAVLAGVTTVTSVKVGAAVTISESGIEASGIGITVANINGGQLSHRNKIINGSQSIFQRGTSETRSGGDDGYYNGLGDRWAIHMHSSVAQTTFSKDTSDNPDGFGSNQKLVRANAGSSNAAKYFVYDTKLEGQDLQDFAKGTSSAKEFTLSFYVKTGVSGVYCVEMRDLDNSRMVGGTYTVSNSNWNRYVITFPADTTGKFDNDNGGSLWVRFWLAAGSNFTSGTARTAWAGSISDSVLAVGQTAQVGDNVADTWQITGVQLEVGSQATPFEHRPAGEELALCQRYYFKFLEGNNKEIGVAWYYLNTHASFFFRFPTTMRAAPTGTDTTGSSYYTIYRVGGPDAMDSITFENSSTEQISAYNSGGVSGTAGQAGLIRSTNASAKIEFSAEL